MLGLGLQRVRVSSQSCFGNKTELHDRRTSRMEAGLRDSSMLPDTAGCREGLFPELGGLGCCGNFEVYGDIQRKTPNSELA